jgi:hypothetical protein
MLIVWGFDERAVERKSFNPNKNAWETISSFISLFHGSRTFARQKVKLIFLIPKPRLACHHRQSGPRCRLTAFEEICPCNQNKESRAEARKQSETPNDGEKMRLLAVAPCFASFFASPVQFRFRHRSRRISLRAVLVVRDLSKKYFSGQREKFEILLERSFKACEQEEEEKFIPFINLQWIKVEMECEEAKVESE